MFKTKLVSSLEKPFLNSRIEDYRPLSFIRMMKNQRLSFQLLHTLVGIDTPFRAMLALKIEGLPAEYVTARTVELVPVAYPIYPEIRDDNYLSKEPGLYPDWLQPLHYGGVISVMKNQLRAVWIQFDPKGGVPAGSYTVTVSLMTGEEAVASETLTIEVLNAELPPQEMKVTQWFHCDCLANYYHCEPWSERHWEIVENFARTARHNGINLLLTPLFTPALDTAVGGERTTTQLLDITVTDGEYSFGFDKLDRWIEMCDRLDIPYFEISHLFTQWGAGHAPKVMATVDGEYKRIFGWDTDATGEEYARFLRTMLTAFLDHMKARGDDKRCLFHISDEPNMDQLEQYKRSKAVVADLLEGYTIMDALSNFEFYRDGIVETPIPSTNHIEPFIESKVPDLWTYYCCGQCLDVSNRLLAMPGWRTRSIGMQFYKYDIAGFLQWGYNFYNNMHSVNTVNPYADVSGEYWVPAGDPFSVYPAEDGTAYESIRIIQFHEALEDCRAMKLAESFWGKERVISEIEAVFGKEIKFSRCAKSADMMLAIRAKVDELIAEAVKQTVMTDYTLHGDGIHDDTDAIQALIDSGVCEVSLPAPKVRYLISRPLVIPSNFKLKLPRYAEIKLADGSNCFMLQNKVVSKPETRLRDFLFPLHKELWKFYDLYSPEAEDSCHDFEIEGGIWNFNNLNQDPNPIYTGQFDERNYLGHVMFFYNVRNFRISNLTVKDPANYAIMVDTGAYFTMENLTFDFNDGNPIASNMDGVHLNGNCHYGVIRNLQGACYDDLVALNAHEGSGGDITNIQIDGIFAENCHSAVRLLTVNHRIAHVTISNVFGTYYQYCIGFTKYYPGQTTGCFDAISLSNVHAAKSPRLPVQEAHMGDKTYHFPLIWFQEEIVVRNLSIEHLHRREFVNPIDTVRIEKDAVVEHLSIRDLVVENHTEEDCKGFVNYGTVKNLHMEDCPENELIAEAVK